LPQVFFKAPAEELSDISRKLDIGNQTLQSIDGTLLKMNNVLRGVDRKSEAWVDGQNKMIRLLERIAEK